MSADTTKLKDPTTKIYNGGEKTDQGWGDQVMKKLRPSSLEVSREYPSCVTEGSILVGDCIIAS